MVLISGTLILEAGSGVKVAGFTFLNFGFAQFCPPFLKISALLLLSKLFLFSKF